MEMYKNPLQMMSMMTVLISFVIIFFCRFYGCFNRRVNLNLKKKLFNKSIRLFLKIKFGIKIAFATNCMNKDRF